LFVQRLHLAARIAPACIEQSRSATGTETVPSLAGADACRYDWHSPERGTGLKLPRDLAVVTFANKYLCHAK